MRNPNLCSLLCCPVPRQIDGIPVLCIAASAASPCVRGFVVFRDVFFSSVIIAIFFAALSLPSLVSLVSSLPHQLDIEMPVWFFERCVAALFSFLFLSFLLISLLFFSSTFFSFLSFFFFSFRFFSFSCLPSWLAVPSFCWSITLTYRRTDCASKQQPYPFGTRSAPCAQH